MSESTIRTAIYNILSGVTNIGKVYDYERWAKTWEEFINLFKATIGGVDQILGWEIYRRSAKEEKITIGIGSNEDEITHVFIIAGYMGVKDASATEKIFNTHIETIATAFRSNRTLNDSAEDNGGIQRDIIDTRMFGSVLCHHVELSLTVIKRI
jgi:hypothetical protein